MCQNLNNLDPLAREAERELDRAARQRYPAVFAAIDAHRAALALHRQLSAGGHLDTSGLLASWRHLDGLRERIAEAQQAAGLTVTTF